MAYGSYGRLIVAENQFVQIVIFSFTSFPNRSYAVAIWQNQRVERIGGVFTVTTPGYFLKCAACGKEMKRDDKTLKYVRNAGRKIDHVHEKDCDGKFKMKHAVR